MRVRTVAAMSRQVTIRNALLGTGVMGLWHESTNTVWLDVGLTAAERRCTLAHELVHAERGDVPCGDAVLDVRQEHRVEREAARRLVSWPALLEVSRWARTPVEAAEALDVDLPTLRARIAGLTPREHEVLRRA